MIKEVPSQHPTTNLPGEFVRQLACGILIDTSPHTTMYPDSPPETMLALALRVLLRHELEAARLAMYQRERLVIAGQPALEVEIDLLLHQPSTGARAAIEVAGWAWHRRDRDEYAREIRRERLLRRAIPTECYAAQEVIDDVWGVALEIVGLMGTAWPDFAVVDVPPTLRAMAEAYAGIDRPSAEGTQSGAVTVPVAWSPLDHLRALVSRLPRSTEVGDPGLRALRHDHPRSHEAWHPEEERLVSQAFRSRFDVDAIARAVERKPSAVWRRLRRIGLVVYGPAGGFDDD